MKIKPISTILGIAYLLAAFVCQSVHAGESAHYVTRRNLWTGKRVGTLNTKTLKESGIHNNARKTLSVNSHNKTEKRNLKIITASFEEWRKGTGGPYGLLNESAEWTIAGNSLASKTYRNRKEFIDEVIVPFNARLTGRLVPTVKGIYADGDMIIVHFTAEGTVSDGKPYINTYSWFLRMKDDQIVQATAFFDAIAFNDLWNRVAPSK